MSSVTLYRASGLALLLGFLLILSGFVLRALAIPGVPTPTQEASALFVCLQVLIFSGLALMLFGWLGIVARLAELSGWLGLAGALLFFLGGVVRVGIDAVNWLAAPWLAVHAPPKVAAEVGSGTPEVYVASFVAISLVLGGAVLAELAMLRARMFAAWAGGLMIVAAALYLVVDYFVSFSNPFFSYIVGYVSLLLFVVGLVWMVYALLSAKGEAPGQSIPPP